MSILDKLNMSESPISELFKEYIDEIKSLLTRDEYDYLYHFIKKPTIINLDCFIECKKHFNSEIKKEIIKNYNNIFKDKISISKSLYKKLIIDNTFSSHQIKAIKRLFKFLYHPTQQVYGLYGYAGTGKTTLCVEFVNYLLKNNFINSVALAAPTNKAVNIIKSKFMNYLYNLAKTTEDISFDDLLDTIKKKHKIKIDFITIHKLLNYKLEHDKEGIRVFVSDKLSILKYDLVIIDECSMIPYDMIEDIFKKLDSNKKSKIIFMGDNCQLPPVNELSSSIFNISSFETYTLKKIMRTSQNNIINLCYNIREWIDNIVRAPKIKNYIGGGVYVYKYKSGVDKKDTEWFNKYIENYTDDTASNIILTWTNKQCDYYNDTIRRIIFKDKLIINEYEIGDTLIMNDFYQNSEKFYTSEQIRIKNITTIIRKSHIFSESVKMTEKYKELNNQYISLIKKLNVLISKEYKTWKLSVTKLNNEKSSLSIIYVIHEDDEKTLEKDKSKVIDCIKQFRANVLTRFHEHEAIILKSLWKDFSKIFIDAFANVNIGCSISCHKSQASTYNKVFIDTDDILNNLNIPEAKRCIYTGITRTANEIHILISG